MRIYLARHGQTNYNVQGLCNYDPAVDVHLTESGIRQAQKLAVILKSVNFDCIYTSELNRTLQTAEYINQYHHATIRADARLNDNRSGFEGRTDKEYYAALAAASDKWTARFYDGESLEETKERVRKFLEELKGQPYDTALVITSMTIIQALYGLTHSLTNQQAWGIQVEKGSCMELTI